jgi:signal peptidase I
MNDAVDTVSPEAPQALPKGTVREYWETICLVLIFVLFARTWLFQNSNIPSGSMKDTLLVGDRLLVNSFVFGPTLRDWEKRILPMKEIEKGDIIVFKFPGNPDIPFIKRVIAKEGDVVQLVNNHLFLNGKPVVEPFVRLDESVKNAVVPAPPMPDFREIPPLPDFLTEPSKFEVDRSIPGRVDVRMKEPNAVESIGRSSFGPYRIPEGHLFAMGDNRMNSEDSRYWGALDKKMVLGRAWVIWWSFEEGDYDYMRSSPSDILKRLGDKVVHFVSKTRWKRILQRPE